MNFELGKKYIVEVTEKGIIPIDEFLEERYIDKDHDDLEFLTDEEKTIVINDVLNDLKAEIDRRYWSGMGLPKIHDIIDKRIKENQNDK